MSVLNILNYKDYRFFLKDYFEILKTKKKPYSYRKFAEELGFKPSNFLHLVITGKRNLSEDAVTRITKNIRWNAQSKKYFALLVLYNQTSDQNDKDQYKKELEAYQGKKRGSIDSDRYDFFSHWYMPIIREVVSLKDSLTNLNWIKRKLNLTINEDEIKKAIKSLERLKMVKLKRGKYEQSEEHLSTADEVSSEMVHNYHREMIKLSDQALNFDHEDRDISALTMTLSKAQFGRLKNKLIEFRDEIQQELADENKPKEIVAQLNMQFFKVTKGK